MNTSLPAVEALNGLLLKNHNDGHISLAKNGTPVMPGEQLVLLSGNALLHQIGLGEMALDVGRPFKVDGVSPMLKNIHTQEGIENLIEHALANGIDPVALLESLVPTAAGEELLLGEGGTTIRINPLYGVGSVTAGYETIGPGLLFQSTERYVHMFRLRPEPSFVEEPSIIAPEPREPIQLATEDLAYDETDGLALGSALLKTNVSPQETSIISFAADNATWNSATHTLTANDNSWQLRYDLNTQEYEFRQLRAFNHPDATNPDDNITIPISVSLTRTDGEQISGQFTVGVRDDAPAVEANEVEAPPLIVDETLLSQDAQGDFSAHFLSNFGMDGQASINPIIYNLEIKSVGVDSGLIDSASKAAIYLFMENNEIIGRVGQGGDIAFRISVDGNGQVTLNQERALIHLDPTSHDEATGYLAQDLIALRATIIDGDGDSATAKINIGLSFIFEDDGPRIDASQVIAAEEAVVDETNLAIDTTVSFADNFAPAISHGEDGPGAITYSMALSGSQIGSGLYTLDATDTGTGDLDGIGQGSEIMLTQNGHIITGSANGTDYFTITIDPTSGEVTFNQLQAIWHADAPTNFNERSLLNTTLASDFIVRVTVVDADGDSVSHDLNVGQGVFAIHDDGPKIDVDGAAKPLTVDESDLGINASANFADIFASNYGADGPGSISYTLNVDAGEDSGLVDTASNESVILSLNNGVIEGRTETSNVLVFTVSVDAGGNVTLDQHRAVVHTPDTGPDQSTSLAAGLITLNAIITDRDGDSAQANLDLGKALHFEDDGPSIDVYGAADSLTVDESNLGINASANFADNFLSNYGADGAGSISYALSVEAGADSGLIDTASNESVILSLNNGVIEGRTETSNVLVFTVSVNASGNVTLDQHRAVVHTPDTGPDQSTSLAAGLITLSATITDKDGDSDEASLDLGKALHFEDDGPSIELSESRIDDLTVDETDLNINASADFANNFSSSYGADGAGTLTYALSVDAGEDSGLIDTASNESVILSMNNGVVEGRTETSNILVFTVSVNASGTVTLDQHRAVVHTPDTGPDQSTSLAAGLITLSATITDKDGDSEDVSLDLGKALHFEDDGPSIDVYGMADSLTVDESNLNINASANFADNFISNYGADGAGSISYGLSVETGEDSGLIDTASNESVILSMNNGVVEGRTETSNVLVFTVSVDASGNVTLDQHRAVVHTPDTGPDQSTSLAAGLITLSATITDKDGDSDEANLDLGKALHFEDDGPKIDVDGAAKPLTVDESDLGINASANFADIFASNYGADGPGSISYTLNVDAGEDSGLVDTASNESVILSLNNGVIEGRTETSNVLVFTVSVDAGGNVTLDQLRAVVHTPDTGPDQSTSLAAGLITLSATITDKDGDSEDVSLDLGKALHFEDDGPSIDVYGMADSLTVDETNLSINATANFADNFTSSYGADGPGSISYALSVEAGEDSGLIDTASNESVILSMNNGVIEGRTEISNVLVFTVSVNASGTVTLDQHRAVVHTPDTGPDQSTSLAAGLITLSATITDKDGDSDEANLDLGKALHFEDDGPSIDVYGMADSLTVDESNLNINASANFADNFLSNYGADGAGSISYGLSVEAGTDSGLIDTASNESVILSMNNGVVEGRTETSNVLVFTVSVDASGNVTLDQHRAVVHTPDTGPDQSTSLAAGLITLSATITDKDGDSDEANLDLGKALHFEDDGPSIDVYGMADSLTVDESNLNINASANFADNFLSNYGADGAGSISYGLSVEAGTDSGLIDTASNESVILSMNNGVVEGRTETSNVLVFTVSVNASGTVTLDQLRAVVHTPDTGPDQSTSLAAGLITLSATITDKDGDSDEANLDLGKALHFEDDGPSIDVYGMAYSLTVDESNLNINASANFADNFLSNYGADGAGSISYGLSVEAGTDSGLIDTASNESVILSMNNGVVEGRTETSNVLVFTVSVNASGTVTLDQLRAVVHTPDTGPDQSTSLAAGLITLSATITDKDGDSDEANLDLGKALHFEDDGPSIDVYGMTDSLTVDESNLNINASANFADNFLSNYGADGAGSISYGLSVEAGTDSGLIDTASNESVILSMNNGVVEGRTETSNVLVFTVSVNASGTVTLDQLRAVVHTPDTGPDQSTSLAAGLITLSATITDKDGDRDEANLDLGKALHFEDDGPSIDVYGMADSLTVDETNLNINATANFADNFTSSYGADGAGSISYALSVEAGADSGLIDTASNESVILSMNNGVIEGRTETSNALVFTVSVNASGNVTLDQHRAVVHTPDTGPDQSTSLAASLITLSATITDKDGDSDEASLDLGKALHFEDDGPSIELSEGYIDDLTVDETDLNINASADFANNFSSSYGADGAGTLTYALSVDAGEDSGLIDTASNESVILSLNNGVVEGRTETSNILVFTVSVNASGTVTLDQHRAVVHTPDTGPDQSTSLAAGLITLSATITDKDGDSEDVSLDLGKALHFEDDGPSIDVYGMADSLTVDESNLNINASANFADNFTSSYGADGPGSISYALSVDAGEASGLIDTASNQAVILSLNNGVVEGRTAISNVLVFTVSVNATGTVTLDQHRAVVHTPDTGPDQSTSLAAGLIALNATITDKDGDSEDVSLDLGKALHFKDDGPSIEVTGVADSLIVDESDLSTNTSANFADNFTSSYGADGAGILGYQLGINAGTTGIVDTATNEAVVLSMNGGVVEGRTATSNILVFTVSVNSSGVVTLDQKRAIIHSPDTGPDQSKTLNNANLITLTGTITDKDGDSDSAVINLGKALSFEDDAPTAGSVTVTADEDNLSKGNNNAATGDDNQSNLTGTLPANFGADGGGKIDFAGMHGQTANIGNEAIKYSWSNVTNTLTAYRASGVLGVDDIFKITVNPSTGQYTFALLAAINHHSTADNTEVTNGTVTLNYYVNDADGDITTGTMTVVIDDDIPTVITPESASIGNEAGDSATFALDLDSNIHNNVGADQLGTIDFTGIVNGQQAMGTINGNLVALSSNGFPIRLYLVDHDSNANTPNALEGWIKGAPGAAGASEVFRITLQPDGSYALSNDTYKVDVFAPIGTTIATSISNVGFATAGNKTFNFIDVSGTTEDLLFSGYNRASNSSVTTGTVNTNSTAVGVNNQSMNDGDNLRIDFVNSPSVTGSASNTYDYTSHFDVNNFSFKIVQVGGGTAAGSIETWIRAYNADDDNPSGSSTSTHSQQLADDAQVAISVIKVNGVELNLGSLQTNASGGYLVTGLSLNDVISVSSNSGFNRVEIENARSGPHGVNNASLNGESFDIGLFTYDKIVNDISSVDMNFGLKLTDADGDSSNANLSVHLAEPLFKVGTNTDDDASSNAGYQVGTGTGVITASGGDDILVGDVGGLDVTPKSINLLLILDTSGSMSQQIPFGGSTISRIQALKNSVNNLLSELTTGEALNVRVHMVQFNTGAAAIGTFNLVVNGDPKDGANEALGQAENAINALVAGGGTNYEAAFAQGLVWVNSGGALNDPNVINQTIFISDGAPTYYVTSGGGTGGNGSDTTQQTIFEPLGLDGTNEVAQLEQNFGPIEAVGINVSETNEIYDPPGQADDLTPKQILDKMEGSNPSSLSNNIDSAEELNQVLSDLSPLKNLQTVGDDSIVGDYGDDFLYGDTLFTDDLALAEGLDPLDFPAGSGWAVFQELETNSQYNWSRTDTLNYIETHGHELAQETRLINGNVRTGGDDTINGGPGNDRIFGQEGNDTILAGRGADTVDGGSGDNQIDLGADTDADTLLFNLENLNGHNTIANFDPANDILKFESVLNVNDVDDLNSLLDQNNPFSTSNNGQDLNVNFSSGAQLTFVGLAPSLDVPGLTSLQEIVQTPIVVVNQLGV